MKKESFEKEYETLVKVYEEQGGEKNTFKNEKVSHLLIEQNRILSANSTKGIFMDVNKIENGVKIKMRVEKGFKIENPVHLCFGILPKEGLQEIYPEIEVEDNASVKLIAHCLFPNAVKVKHYMDGNFKVGNGAYLEYSETHFHGDNGGIEVIPRLKVEVGTHGTLRMDFGITSGRVGVLDIDYDIKARDYSNVDVNTRIFARENDTVKIKEGVNLDGEYAKSVIKSRVALRDKAVCEITNITNGNKAYSRGHVDCTEIVQGDARASAIPIVSVAHPLAKVTHEAAIGSIDKKELETLMARGLTKEEAVETIIHGMLR